jgi:glutamyl/glutaminyl-tRNA synthetase
MPADQETSRISDEKQTEPMDIRLNPFTSDDLLAILKERQWLSDFPGPEHRAWCERAASLLGAHAQDRAEITQVLALIFHYDAEDIVAQPGTHITLARYGARAVLRQLALRLLDGPALDSDHFKELITSLKHALDVRGPELFQPLRLALAGRAGNGELDRVILLVDEAANLKFDVPVKSTRQRIIEFCAAVD